MDMISIKSPAEIEKMRAAGRLTAQANRGASSQTAPTALPNRSCARKITRAPTAAENQAFLK